MTTARDLICRKFVCIGENHTAAEAVGIIFDPVASAPRDIVIVVFTTDGDYAGLVEPRNILGSLGTDLSLVGDDAVAQVAAIRNGLACAVAELARRDIPAVRLGDNLATLLLAASRTEASTLPVFDGTTFAGIIPVAVIFEAVCRATISTEGAELPFMNQGEK